MKYRIREEQHYGLSTFYTERWHEPYKEWVAAYHCSFDTLEEAQNGIELFHKDILDIAAKGAILHEYAIKGC